MPKPLSFQHAAAWASAQEEAINRFEAPPHLLLAVTSALCAPTAVTRANRVARERLEWSCREVPQDNPRRFMTRVFGDVNSSLFSAANQDGEPGSLAMAIAGLWTNGLEVAYTHIGNARVYLLRDGLIRPVTQDHTQAQQMVDQALLKPEEARSHPFSREVLRSLGRKPMIDVPVQGPLPAKNGDYYILCTAGLVKRVTDAQIGNTIVEGELLDACNRIVRLAIEAEGDDDDIVAIQALRFGEPPGGRRVEAYNPIDNITRSLMRADISSPPILEDKGVLARMILTFALLLSMMVFLVCDPDCSSPPDSDKATHGSAGDTSDDATAPASDPDSAAPQAGDES